jgi:hypothetical protein
MTPYAPLATTYAETLEYPCGLYDPFIVLAPGKAGGSSQAMGHLGE